MVEAAVDQVAGNELSVDSPNIGRSSIENQLVRQVEVEPQEGTEKGIYVSALNNSLGLGNTNSGFEVSDGTIRTCNKRIALGKGVSQSKKLWGICKEVGVTFRGDDAQMVSLVEELESRDKTTKVAKAEVGGNP